MTPEFCDFFISSIGRVKKRDCRYGSAPPYKYDDTISSSPFLMAFTSIVSLNGTNKRPIPIRQHSPIEKKTVSGLHKDGYVFLSLCSISDYIPDRDGGSVHKFIHPFHLVPRIPIVLEPQLLAPSPRCLLLFRGLGQVPILVVLVRPTGVAIRGAPGGSVIPLLQLVQRIVLVSPVHRNLRRGVHRLNRERGPIADFIIALLECGYCYAMLISPFHSVGVKMYAIDWPEK